MSSIDRGTIEQALREWIDPDLDRDPVAAGCVCEIAVDGGRVTVDLEYGFPLDVEREARGRAIREHLEAIDGVERAEAGIDWRIAPGEIHSQAQRIEGVANIFAVASAKGGVGKSTTAATLALGLHAEGARVGVLDADIYGPSQPRMLGIEGKPSSPDGQNIVPMEGHGVQAMSIGFLVDPESPMIWRGPMVTKALEQMLYNTQWRELDYLVVDLPPGTGDIQLTLVQKVPLSGAVIVTTPQDIALLDARKGLKMFEQVSVPVLGVVENMSMHVCSHCGHAEPIFGEGGGARMAADHGVRLLGQLPLDPGIREHADGGTPTVIADPASEAARIYREVARRTGAAQALAGTLPSSFPNLRIVDD
jgi:ATP-binding protein involved in chromosome partitioning